MECPRLGEERAFRHRSWRAGPGVVGAQTRRTHPGRGLRRRDSDEENLRSPSRRVTPVMRRRIDTYAIVGVAIALMSLRLSPDESLRRRSCASRSILCKQ
jgi:hypothetical protein